MNPIDKLLEMQSQICQLREQQNRLIAQEQGEQGKQIREAWYKAHTNVWDEHAELLRLKETLTENT
jgi:hypothetical protein